MADHRRSTWERIKDIPGFVAAIIALVSVLISAAVFVIGYFATRDQLRTVDCVYRSWTDALSGQIEQLTLLNLYSAKKNEWTAKKSQLDLSPKNNLLRIEIDEIKREMDNSLQKIDTARESSMKAIAAKEECLKKGSPLSPL